MQAETWTHHPRTHAWPSTTSGHSTHCSDASGADTQDRGLEARLVDLFREPHHAPQPPLLLARWRRGRGRFGEDDPVENRLRRLP